MQKEQDTEKKRTVQEKDTEKGKFSTSIILNEKCMISMRNQPGLELQLSEKVGKLTVNHIAP